MNNFACIEKRGVFAKINLNRGANLFSLIIDGVSLLREPNYSKPLDNPFLYGMPILFPVNRISNGKFNFEGREYNFPINEEKTNCHLHGDLHKTTFNIKKLTKSSVVCVYNATKNTPYLNFPHEFTFEIHYKIINNGVKIKTTITNKSTKNMPVLFGYHTTFNFENNCFVKVGASVEYERDDNYLPTGKTLRFDDVSNDLIGGKFNSVSTAISRHYKCKKCGKIAIYNKNSNSTVLYKNSKNLPFRLIYSNGNGYICLEPQTCLVNALNSCVNQKDSGFSFIKPNKKLVFTSKILLIKGDKR